MGWKEWPLWVKGGVIGVVYGLITSFAFSSCSGGLGCFFLVLPTSILIINFLNLPEFILNNEIWVRLTYIILHTILTVVIGAIIGLIVGKIRQRKAEA